MLKFFLLVCLLQLVESGSWQKLGHGCVGTRNDRYKEITYNGASKFIGAMKLVHTKGYIGCHAATSSNWGCEPRSIHLSMIITDSNNQIIYPSPRLAKIDNGWYKLPGYTSSSTKLVFTDFGYPKYLKTGEKLRVWYGEDLYGYTEHDNHGFTCMDIYAYFMAI